MSITWHHIPEQSGAGLQEQWQARVGGRSVAVVRRAACEYPRCTCAEATSPCPAHVWVGLMIGPDGLLVDIEVTGTPVAPQVKTKVEQGLASMGWRI